MFAQNMCPVLFYQVLWKFHLHGDYENFGKRNSAVHLDCLWQKHEQKTWCQKFSNVYQMDVRYTVLDQEIGQRQQQVKCSLLNDPWDVQNSKNISPKVIP